MINFCLLLKKGQTPLHVAAETGAEATAKLIIEIDPDMILAKDYEGKTAADIADRAGKNHQKKTTFISIVC